MSLVKTLEIKDLEHQISLQKVAAFATLISTYQTGFIVLIEPFENDNDTIPNPVLHLSLVFTAFTARIPLHFMRTYSLIFFQIYRCMDATVAIKPIFNRFSSVVITSGTLSPLDLYPVLLGFEPIVVASYKMSLTRTSFLPLVSTPISFSYSQF